MQDVIYDATGTYTGTVTVTDDAGGKGRGKSCTASATVTVTGGQQQFCNIAVSPTSLAFGNVDLGSSSTLSTTVSNAGDAACDVSITPSGTTEFAASPLNFSVTPGQAQTVSVSYTPTGTGSDSGSLSVGSNDPDTPTVSVGLSGTGVQPQQACNLSASPASLAFGDVNVGSSSTLDTTLSNSGNGRAT